MAQFPIMTNPTPYPDVNAIVHDLLARVQAILGPHFIGMVLDGSLANGDFDQDSDIDFVVVTDEDVSPDLFLALQAMHDQMATLDSPWAIQLEGSYISRHAIRRYDPAHARHPNIERGQGERLKWAEHGPAWITHRYVLREHGIPLAGPAPHTLIDPVGPDDLRRGMADLVDVWLTPLLNQPEVIRTRGYQSYIVLSLCRMLYTLECGTVVSKRVAADWAKAHRGQPWTALIERAWAGRRGPDAPASPEEVNETLAFVRFVLARNP